MAALDKKIVWTSVLECLRQDFSTTSFDTWFSDLELAYLSTELVILIGKSDFKCDVIQEKYTEKIAEHFSSFMGLFPRVIVVSGERNDPDIAAIVKNPDAPRSQPYIPKVGPAAFLEHDKHSAPQGDYLNNIAKDAYTAAENEQPAVTEAKLSPADNYNFDYSFENFIVGSSNRFAHAACTAVANSPARAYNPLFIYGPSGLGKTHLMYAIKEAIRVGFPSFKLIYIKGEDFTNQLIHSIGNNTTAAFRDRYRGCDVLLIDDIQFIAGKVSTQEEFFHTFNALYEDKRQIILTCDRPPRDINTLEERLKTRFEWGLIADVQPPDLELRVAIILNKAAQVNLDLPDDVLNYLAENLQSNIRQIEGAIRKLSALTFLSGHTISMELARSAVSELLGGKGSVNVTLDKIVGAVSKKYGVSREDLLSPKRTKHVTGARHICIYIIRNSTDMSLPSIGKYFSRDHTTVLWSIEVVEKRCGEDPIFALELADLQKQIKA